MRQLNEITKRSFGATKALILKRHGDSLIFKASRANWATIFKGILEMKSDAQLPMGRVRKN